MNKHNSCYSDTAYDRVYFYIITASAMNHNGDVKKALQHVDFACQSKENEVKALEAPKGLGKHVGNLNICVCSVN